MQTTVRVKVVNAARRRYAATASCVVCLTSIVIVAIEFFHRLQYAASSVAIVCAVLGVVAFRNLSTDVALAVIAALTAHVVVGMYFDLYTSSTVYDKIVHLVVTAGVVLLLLERARRCLYALKIELSPILKAASPTALAVLIGCLWEMFEFLLDQTGLFVTQRGLRDTMLDLYSDAAGGVMVTLFTVLKARAGPFRRRTTCNVG